MACGICGGAGHNRRTCSAGSYSGGSSSYSTYNTSTPSYGYGSGYSYNYSPPAPRRTVTCGICGQPGHNSRTCSYGSSSQSTTSYFKSSGYGGLSAYGALLSVTNANPEPRRTVTCGTCGQQGHNSQTCTSSRETSSYSSRSSTISAHASIFSLGDSPPASRRTVTCGTCGQQGHNSRTCTTGVSSQSTTASTRTVTCSTCGQPGHNKRTCTTCSSSQSTAASKRTVTCGTCGITGHNSTTCTAGLSRGSVRNYSTYRSSSGLDDVKCSETKKTVTCGTCGEQGHNRRTCDTDPNNNLDIRGAQPSISKTAEDKTKAKEVPKPQDKLKCVICGDKDHTYDTCKHGKDLDSLFAKARETIEKRANKEKVVKPNVLETKTVKKPEVKLTVNLDRPRPLNLGKVVLNQEAKEKLDKGPSEHDGKGYIYMYREANPGKGGYNHYKIGMTKREPLQRIRDQERNNDIDYDYVFRVPTNNRRLAEAVIHAQLKECHEPKEEGDGRSEWFRGQREEFINVIERCQQIVDKKYTENNI